MTARTEDQPTGELEWRPLMLVENVAMIAVGAALTVMSVLITVDAAGRYLLGFSVPGAQSITEMFLMPVIVFLAWSATQRRRRHVAVDIVRQKLHGAADLITGLVVDLLSLGMMLLVLKTAYDQTADSWGLMTVEDVSLPMGWSRALVLVGGVLLVLRMLLQITGGVRGLVMRRGSRDA